MPSIDEQLKARRVILYPITSEKAMNMIERENTITFAVDIKASKSDVKRAVKILYEVEVEDIRTIITHKGYKKAYIRLAEGYSASDLAIKLGMI
ncbi:MAG: 50S ribosomal protein L23 [Nitrososphaerota archaeon]|nr:50S ribosomal protein L23 [Candidatus Bathyarchaeota archaeon]MCX8161846.1 50S ribosomal protein L23 [Candidatus Bathyarchaeota archaeon]MDW8062393.1 50S ribosomal protein L23 [Nitrososphaerota archaeon]